MWRVLLMFFLVIAIFLARQSLIILFLAIVISSALDAPVHYLEKKGFPRILGTLLIFFAALIVLAAVLYVIIPIGISELQNILKNLGNLKIPNLGTLTISQFGQFNKYVGNLDSIVNMLMSGGVSFFSLISGVFNNLVFIIATFILSLYLTINKFGVEKFLKTILPITYEDYVVEIYLRVRRKIGYWLQGQLVLMAMMGVLVGLGLWILGVKYSLVLGVVAGIFEIVPMVGPVFSGAIAFFAAVAESWTLGLYVVLLFILLQQAEGHLLVPLVMKKTLGISPVVIVVSLLAGWEIAGVVGALLAVPVAVIFQEIVDDFERRKLRRGRLLSNE